ncbi:MAG: FHA domain-containing protein [Proteobacteria bacterium]|nr:FHA domain-containing protein [Pseudomonadota bacterium]
MAKVLVFRGRRKEATHDLNKREVILGRGDDADIRVDNPLVSRRHATLSFRDSEWRIADLDSPNGVYVNGEQVTDRVLQVGDRIELGQHVVVFAGAGESAWDGVDTVADRKPDFTADEATAVLPKKDIESIHRKVGERLKAHLVVEGDGKRTEVPLVARPLVLGFADDCDVRLPGKALFGKKAAEVVPQGKGWAVIALTSLVPVKVAGQKVSSHPLTDGDVIEIKDARITIHTAIAPD